MRRWFAVMAVIGMRAAPAAAQEVDAVSPPVPAPAPASQPADQRDVMVGADDRYREAFEHYDRGRRFFADEDFVAAAVEFRQSYHLFALIARDDSGGIADPQARDYSRRALSNQATSFAQADMPVDAYDAFALLRSEFGAELDPEFRLAVDDALAKLEQRIGTATIRGWPEGAVVRLDGRLYGADELASPLRLAAGQHAVDVRAEGFKPFTRSFAVVGKRAHTVDVEMQPSEELARVRVEVSVQPSRVWIDGESRGSAPLEVSLPPGEHTFKVVSESYMDHTGKFTARPGEDHVLTVGMVPRRAPLGFGIVGGFRMIYNLRGDTPFNQPTLSEDDDFSEGFRAAFGGALRLYWSKIRFQGLNVAVELAYVERPLNKFGVGLGVDWCPDRFLVENPTQPGMGVHWCPVTLGFVKNLGGGEVRQFTGGENTVRWGTQLLLNLKSFKVIIGGGYALETYRRSALVNLSLGTVFIEMGFGLDL